MDMLTKTDKVNLRSSPDFGNNRQTQLPLATRVLITGDQAGDRWLPVTVVDSGDNGYISERVLRDPLNDEKEVLLQKTIQQWLRFKRGLSKENEHPWHEYVGEYWSLLGINLDGQDRDAPWSAAFISAVIRWAGAYDGFTYAAAHARYCHAAIRAKIDGDEYPFWGCRIEDHKPQLGDMVCRWRLRRIDYDYAASTRHYSSHCDIVVEIADNNVVTIGGNVGHSVSTTRYPINDQGFLTGEGNVYAVLQNRR